MARIVVVEDSRFMGEFVRLALAAAGHEAETWEPPAASEIPARLEAAAPDLLVTDYRMPGCSGATLARQARKARPALKSLMLTSSHEPEVSRLAEQGIVDAVAYKPLDPEGIRTVVSGILAGPDLSKGT